MNGIVLYNALTRIDETLIAHAVETPARPARVRRPARLVPLLAGCACLILVCGVAVFARFAGFLNGGKKNAAPSGNGTTAIAQTDCTVLTDYTALLYANSAGGGSDNSTPRYTGEEFFIMERYEKAIQSRKNEYLFGKTWNVYYDYSLKSDNLSYDMDAYSYVKGYDCVSVTYRMDTGRIVNYYAPPSPETFEGSSISPDSSEEAIVSYARSVLREITGETADGWDVRIESASFPYYRSDTMGPLSAEGYTVTFFKTIGGVERGDRMSVKMTDAGEIVGFNAFNYDAAFAPYGNVHPDKEKIEEAAWRAFGSSGIHGYSSASIREIELFVSENSLWALVSIDYKTGEWYGGVQYAIEVARIE